MELQKAEPIMLFAYAYFEDRRLSMNLNQELAGALSVLQEQADPFSNREIAHRFVSRLKQRTVRDLPRHNMVQA